MKNKNYRSQICSKTKSIENKTNIFGQDEISSKGIPYDIKCYDFDRLILTKLLICSLVRELLCHPLRKCIFIAHKKSTVSGIISPCISIDYMY